MSTANMNIRPSAKYGSSPEEVEKRALESERFKVLYNMHRLEKTNKLNQRQDRCNKKKCFRKWKKLRENLNIGEKSVYFRRKNKEKDCTWTIYKQSVQNISYFNKDVIYSIRKKHIIDNIRYYWLKSPLKNLPKRFQRTELFALKSNFWEF